MSEQEYPEEDSPRRARAGRAGAPSARPSVGSRNVVSGRERPRAERQRAGRSYGSGAQGSPAGTRSPHRVDSSHERGLQRGAASPSRTRTRSAEVERRLSEHTRRSVDASSGRATNRAQRSDRESRVQEPAIERRLSASGSQARAGARGAAAIALGILARIWDVLRAAAGAAVRGADALRERVPALQRFPSPAIASAAAVLVVLVVGVGVASAVGGSPEGDSSQLAEVQMGDSGQGGQTSGAGAVNPDEPADLVWRDSDFALDPAYAGGWSNNDNGRKVVYLTIDDGPSELTEPMLDLLDRYGVKATFFVTGHDPNYYGMIREAYNRGHTIGLHTMTHDYAQVYASEQAYYDDLDQVGKVVEQQIGYVPCFIRFPGGSSNSMASNYSPGLMKKLVKGVLARGYQYYDWSLSSGDGEVRSTQELIDQSTKPNGAGEGADPTRDVNIVILCHDSATKQTTLEALPTIIEHYQKRGYSFEAIDRSTWICHHAVYDDGTGDSGADQADGSEAYDAAAEDDQAAGGRSAAEGYDGSLDGSAEDATSEYGQTEG